MANEKQRKVITVTGKTGRGKSHLTEKYLAVNFAKSLPVIVADSMGEYSTGAQYKSVDQFWQEIRNDGLTNGVYAVPVKSDIDAVKLFTISEKCGVPHCLIVEEASKYCSPHSIDERLYNIVSYGRHSGISVVLSAQRFAQINRLMTSQSDFFITFQQTELNDLNKLKSYTNNIEMIKNLDKREFIVFGDIDKNSHFVENKVLTLQNDKIKSVK